ncbi:hypothetical protein ACVGVM_29700 (plasmid) [Pseudonocardia bannensis]|uniref:Uncharacterized protein n=1 Tax=Pseudonocardia bannensis TaxID=630973 RepID=A0A848DPU4_9PSEU|nr:MULTISPECIES: hypothetical protein [Pseudonocardia]NMH94543.1 hypothetical protein [Pseudonocardia bannensis]
MLIWFVATILLLLALVLSVTVLLLPVGLLLGLAALRLYRVGLGLLLPRPREVRKGVRKQVRRWRRKGPVRELDRSARTVRRQAREAGRTVRRRLHR